MGGGDGVEKQTGHNDYTHVSKDSQVIAIYMSCVTPGFTLTVTENNSLGFNF